MLFLLLSSNLISFFHPVTINEMLYVASLFHMQKPDFLSLGTSFVAYAQRMFQGHELHG
jgi:hypothetical protein